MCERASRSKLTLPREGSNLSEQLKLVDKITSDEERMIMEDQREKFGDKFNLYERMDNILNKILNEVSGL